MNNRNNVIAVLALVVIALLGLTSGYTLREGEQVVITLFGKPQRMVKSAGFHLKWPFVERIRPIDLRILNWDGYRNQIPTRDKKYILVDTTARWRIVNPLKFIQSVQSEVGARSRLDAILDAATRDIVSSQNLVEAVRNSNQIFDEIQKRIEAAKAPANENGGEPAAVANVEEEEVVGDLEKVEIGREHLSRLIIERAKQELEPIGIELIDVQLRHIMYEASVQKKVYARMISERERIAEKIRSIGRGEQAKIKGKTTRELQEIESGAYRKAQQIKGEAEAKAIAIYAGVLSKDPNFYEFSRKLEVYKNSIKPETQLILSTGTDLFDVLRNGKK